jgi:hypothetical protein
MRHVWIACLWVACDRTEEPTLALGQLADVEEPTPVIRNIPKARVTVESSRALDDTSLTANAMLERVTSTYMAGIKRCYASGLQNQTSLRGRVTLKFQVTDAGRVDSVLVTGFAKDIDTCLSDRLAKWVFGAPKDKKGEATNASFEIVLQLVPS